MIRLILPMPVNVANARLHWSARHRAKVGYWDACDMRVMLKLVPKAPKKPLDPAQIAVTLYVHNIMDHDNAMARTKPVLDWLVSRGYIADDAPKNLKWAGLPEQTVDRANPRIELTLEAA